MFFHLRRQFSTHYYVEYNGQEIKQPNHEIEEDNGDEEDDDDDDDDDDDNDDEEDDDDDDDDDDEVSSGQVAACKVPDAKCSVHVEARNVNMCKA